MPDTSRVERGRPGDFQKFLEDVRALKNRLQNIELARLDDDRTSTLESALKEAAKKARSGSPEEIQRLQQEAKRFVEAEHGHSRDILTAKFEKFEANLALLSHFLRDLGPVKELEARVAAENERIKKLDEELNVRKKVMDHEATQLEQDRAKLRTSEDALAKRAREVEALARRADVARRAEELDRLQGDLDLKFKAYEVEMDALRRQREDLNRDFDKLGQKRVELDREQDRLAEERRKLESEKTDLAARVAKEMACTFEAFVRDMFRDEKALGRRP